MFTNRVAFNGKIGFPKSLREGLTSANPSNPDLKFYFGPFWDLLKISLESRIGAGGVSMKLNTIDNCSCYAWKVCPNISLGECQYLEDPVRPRLGVEHSSGQRSIYRIMMLVALAL